jgi:predicted acylesterase/phospholipase RssA
MASQHVAVVLSGGAALAAYEVGVMKALFEGECASTNYQRLDPGIITGTSAGAVNGAVLVSQGGVEIRRAVEYLEAAWVQLIAGETAASANGVFRVRLDPRQYAGGLGEMAAAAAEDGAELTRSIIRRGYNFALSRSDSAQGLIAQVDFTELISTEPFGHTLRRVIDASNIRESISRQ